jgi:SNF2 family DNA or RNA helicase
VGCGLWAQRFIFRAIKKMISICYISIGIINYLSIMKLIRFPLMLERSQLDHKDYQEEGVSWCCDNELAGHAGGIIADEMGLGKTITMIGVLLENFRTRTLVVLPVALIEQWAAQVYKLVGHKPLIYHGRGKNVDMETLLKAPLVLTTYGMININPKKAEVERADSLLHKIRWDRVIFDEAHHMRNSRAGRHVGASMLQTEIRWLVTGTPVQNKKRDFYSLCMLLKKTPEQVVERFMLRRTKAQVGVYIPKLNAHSSSVAWTHEGEKELAEEIHSALHFSNISMEKSSLIGKMICDTEDDNKRRLVMLMRAKQSCTLPLLIAPQIQRLVDTGIIDRNHPFSQAMHCSSKMDALVDCVVSRKSNGNGKLIFCTYRQEIEMVANLLREEGMIVATLDGRTKKKARSEICSGNSKYQAVVLQIQTCCEGLNLQAQFSEVYFMTPHWNPSIEDQAVARCHRIGQTKPVEVFRFAMSAHEFMPVKDSALRPITFDNHVVSVQDSKRVLSSEVLLDVTS